MQWDIFQLVFVIVGPWDIQSASLQVQWAATEVGFED